MIAKRIFIALCFFLAGEMSYFIYNGVKGLK